MIESHCERRRHEHLHRDRHYWWWASRTCYQLLLELSGPGAHRAGTGEAGREYLAKPSLGFIQTQHPQLAIFHAGAWITSANPNGFLSRDEIVKYFEGYVERFHLPVQYGVHTPGHEERDRASLCRRDERRHIRSTKRRHCYWVVSKAEASRIQRKFSATN